ncbi:MAG: M48 family metalloprotease [Bacteroidetes bacterium]|nr:M48 family metalloprotease [Bacteroidota bacterium]MBU1113817.1 M48 family metalloprotease [Bacteroidota bacterium]MBU1799597.1 M48 family metalloprotease [Bacteroidota bacterium]
MFNLFSETAFTTLGWTLVHSIWQGFVIALLLMFLLSLINKRNSQVRSLLSYSALLVLVALSIRTYSDMRTDNVNIVETSTKSELLINSSHEVQRENSSIPLASLDFKSISFEYLITIKSFISANMKTIVFLWFLGIFALSIKLLGGLLYAQRLKKREVYPVSQFWNHKLKSLKNKLQIEKKIDLMQSKYIKTPLTIGHFKPIILLPVELLSGIPQDQLEIVLAHELAHIKRADYLLNILQSIIEVFFFFNPAVWLISNQIRKEREFLCDDLAVISCGNSTNLANALITLHENGNTKINIAMSAIGNNNSLMGRIKRMKQENQKQKQKQLGMALLIIPFLLFTILLACSTAEDINKNGLNIPSEFESITQLEDIESIEKLEMDITKMEERSSENVMRGNATESKRKKFNFHAKGAKWKAYFEEGKLVELFKDDTRLTDDELAEYKDFVDKRYEEYQEDMADFEVDMDELKINLKQLKSDLSGLKNIKIDFDAEDFKESMKQMKCELKKGLEELKDLNINIDIDFDVDALNEELKKIKIDLGDFDFDMENLKVEMTSLKKEMKVLKLFMQDMKSELVSDGYINDEDEDYSLKLSKSKMVVNGERLPDNLHQKYLEMYKEHYGKDLDDEFKIHR